MSETSLPDERSPHFINYDRAVNLFSPDGRLLQIEYAKEAVNRGGTVIVLKFTNERESGIIVGTTRFSSILWESEARTKVHCLIDDRVFMTSCGIVSDSNYLLNEVRYLINSEESNLEQAPSIYSIANFVSRTNHYFTTIGGLRPLGVSMLVFGFDHTLKHQIFEIDPSGVILSTKVSVLGKGHHDLLKKLEISYKEEMTSDEACLFVKKYLKPVPKEHVFIDLRLIVHDKQSGLIHVRDL